MSAPGSVPSVAVALNGDVADSEPSAASPSLLTESTYLLPAGYIPWNCASTCANALPTTFHVYRQLNALLARLRAALTARGIDGASDDN